MSWIARLKARWAAEPRPRLIHDPELLAWLEQVALDEQRPVDEVTEELLYSALRQRQTADRHLALWQQLTPREKQVVALACLDYTNQEIAQQLSISPHTVKTHLRNILGKFQLDSKVDLNQMLNEWDFRVWLEKQDVGLLDD